MPNPQEPSPRASHIHPLRPSHSVDHCAPGTIRVRRNDGVTTVLNDGDPGYAAAAAASRALAIARWRRRHGTASLAEAIALDYQKLEEEFGSDVLAESIQRARALDAAYLNALALIAEYNVTDYPDLD